MPDWWETDGEQEVDGAGAGDDGEAAKAAESLEALKAQIAVLPEGSQLRKLYEEVLKLNEERQAKAQAEADAMARLEVEVDSGFVDYESPEVQEALRIREQKKQADTDAKDLAATAALLEKQGFADDYIAGKLAELKEKQAALAEFNAPRVYTDPDTDAVVGRGAGADPLHDSPVWRAHELAVYQETRAVELAEDLKSNRPGQWDRDVEDAQAGIDSTVDAVLAEF